MDATPTGSGGSWGGCFPGVWRPRAMGMGMLRIPRICCTPWGAEGRGVCPLGTKSDREKFRAMRWGRIPKSSPVQVVKYRPSGGSMERAPFRRYLPLRERHLRLCTFASPRRAPSGHKDSWARRQVGMETSGHKDIRAWRQRWACRPPGTGRARHRDLYARTSRYAKQTS